MVDFRKLHKEWLAKLPPEKRPKKRITVPIPARRFSSYHHFQTYEDVEIEATVIMYNKNDEYPTFLLIGGPTGSESLYIREDNLDVFRNGTPWNACNGTIPVGTAGGWDRMRVEGGDIIRALRSLKEKGVKELQDIEV